MISSISRASSSPPFAQEHAGNANPAPLFAKHPPIYVLPTRLTLEELHSLEAELGRYNANLTYDVSEARIFLSTITQKKRAALELRARGLWTQDASLLSLQSPKDGVSGQEKSFPPARKKRRLNATSGKGQSRQEPVDLSSTESESADPLMQVLSAGDKHEQEDQEPKALSQPSSSADDGQEDRTLIVRENHIKVVKLEWVAASIAAGRALDIDPFVVYHGKIIGRPQELASAHTITSPSARSATDTAGILARAKDDAASRPAPSSPSSRFSRFAHPSSRYATTPGGGESSQHYHPPTLYRQSTFEHDSKVPIPPAPDWVKNRIVYACMRSAPLHPPNEVFIDELVKIRRIRELTLDEIGVRAYSTSIAAVAAYPYEIRTPIEVLSLPGCDTKIANLFVEYRNSVDGKLEAAEALDSDPIIRTIHQFYKIWGVGAKTAREFYYQRQWRNLDDVIEHGWNSLSRVQQIGLKYYDEFLAGIPRSEVTEIAKTIHSHANSVRPSCDYDGQGIECIIVGGYRRGKETSGDIDLILSHRDERVTKDLVLDVVSSLENEGWITHTLALHMTTSNREQQTLPFRGDPGSHHFDSLDKALVVWQDPHFTEVGTTTDDDSEETAADPTTIKKKNTNPHRRVDIIVSPWRTVGCAVLGWSGDKTFERDLRRYAKKIHGWKFDSSGVRERTTGGHVIDLEKGGRTWEERERLVMEGLGVGWRPATERCTR